MTEDEVFEIIMDTFDFGGGYSGYEEAAREAAKKIVEGWVHDGWDWWPA